MIFSADDGCDVGEDTGAPVSQDYGPRGNAFTGPRLAAATSSITGQRYIGCGSSRLATPDQLAGPTGKGEGAASRAVPASAVSM